MRVYKFYPAKYGRESILRQRLKLSTLADLNDPFELRAIGSEEKSARRVFDEWRTGFAKEIGLISFCETKSSPVLWSHYADRLTGICLGFDVAREILHPVRYVTERKKMSLQDLRKALREGGSQDTSTLFTTKFAHWQYEQELRVIFNLREDDVFAEGGLYFVGFGGRFALREVILGPDYEPVKDTATSAELRKKLSAFPGCSLITGRLAFQDFSIRMQQRDDLQKPL